MVQKNELEFSPVTMQLLQGCYEELVLVSCMAEPTNPFPSSVSTTVRYISCVADEAAAWNYCFSLARFEYILYLRPDERIAPEDAKRLKRLISRPLNDIDAYFMKTVFAGVPYWQPRLVRRTEYYLWHGAIEPFLYADGKKEKIDISFQRTISRNTWE